MTRSGNKVKIAVIACGRIAWLGFLPWIKAHPGAELVAVADIDEEQARKSAKKFGARHWYTDWRELIEKSGAHAVCVTTPPWLHAEPVIMAAEHGMHVLCEKPMAPTVEDCRRMVSACEKNNVRLQIGFSLRFDPGYEKLKVMVKTGEIGDVFQLKSIYDIWVPDISKSPFKEIMELAGKLKVWGTSDMGAWRMTDERAGGGVFSDHGIHYTDLFRWIMDEDVTLVTGVTQKIVPGRASEDHASAMLRFEGGVAAYIESSLCRLSARKEIDEGMIHGTRGCLKYEMDQSWYIRGFPHLNNVHARLWHYGTPSFIIDRWLPVHVKHGRKYVLFKRQMDYFISKINSTFKPHPVFGDKWAATGEDGLKAIQVVKAVYESSEKNKSVKI